MDFINRTSDFYSSRIADQQVSDTPVDNYESENDIAKRSEDFIKNFKTEGYVPPTKNDWLPFILNCLYYIVLVLIVGIIGANLNILSEGMHKTKNGNSGLENKLRKIFPHTQFAMDKLRIDESIDPYPQKVGEREFPYDDWCSVCDLTVQFRLLFIHWPLKIFDASNYMMFTLFSSFITKYIKSSGVLKNFIIPILLLGLVYIQLPIIVSLIAALGCSMLHPHFLQYWIGIVVSWKYIKKYVKSFLKIITGLKKISYGETPVDTQVYYQTNQYLKDVWNQAGGEEADTDSTTSPDWEKVTKIVDYLNQQEKELSKTTSGLNLDDKIRKSIENKYSGDGSAVMGADGASLLPLAQEKLKDYIYPDDDEQPIDWLENFKNINFLIELWVLKNVTFYYHDTNDVRKGKRKTANEIISNLNAYDGIDVEEGIIKTILRKVEDDGKRMNDQEFITQKQKIKDGMWSWEEWSDNTGRGTGIEETDSSELTGTDGGSYYKYKINWKIEKRKKQKQIDKDRKKNQKRYDRKAWVVLGACIALQTAYYVINYNLARSNSSDIESKTISNDNDNGSKINSSDTNAVGGSARVRDQSKAVLASKLGEKGALVFTAFDYFERILKSFGSGFIFLLSTGTTIATKNASLTAVIVSLLKLIAIYLIFGWWVIPTYGLGICIAYSISTQMKIISLLMFSSLNKKYINATTDYLKNNRYGLTIMGLLMLSYSAMTYLRPNVAVGAFVSLIVCSIIIICCL